MNDSSTFNESKDKKEDIITDLNEGPWPGPIEQQVTSGSINFGNQRLKEYSELKVKKHNEQNSWYRTASAVIKSYETIKDRWDYKAEVLLKEQNKPLLGGVCLKGKKTSNGLFRLEFRDSSFSLLQGRLNVTFFGMTNKEILFWMPQFAGFSESHIQSFTPDNTSRPFIYGIPLQGLKLEKRKVLRINDVGIVSGDADDAIYPIIKQLKIHEKVPIWKKDTPKAFGVVMARSFIEAEKLALQRANLIIDIINFALKTGVSHWEDRYYLEILEWAQDNTGADIRMSEWILLREARTRKGWVRVPIFDSNDSLISINKVNDRLMLFLKRFINVTTIGDIASQTNRRKIMKNEKTLIDSIQRALHWYGIATKEKENLDRFLAIWITLEAILDCITYPGVFDGQRQNVKIFLDKSIKKAPYPKCEDKLFDISAEIFRNRLLTSDWSIPRKLELFAKSFKVSLQKNDVNLVRELAKLRGEVLHCGSHNIDLPNTKLREMEYLTERLIIAASVCAYAKLEDEQKHTLKILPIGPKGGSAPILFDGKEVPYELHFLQKDSGEQVEEWVIDGLIYDNRKIEKI